MGGGWVVVVAVVVGVNTSKPDQMSWLSAGQLAATYDEAAEATTWLARLLPPPQTLHSAPVPLEG